MAEFEIKTIAMNNKLSQKASEIPNSSKELIEQLRKLINHRKPVTKRRLCGRKEIFLVASKESWLATVGYILGDVIAVGGCRTVVHRADDMLGNGRVAVKVVRLIQLRKRGMNRDYIKFSIRDRWAKLSHPHICHLHDVIIGRRKAFFITQFACQGDVQRFIQNEDKYRSVFPSTVRRWCWQLTSALNYLHNQRLSHCDLKLENILLNCNLNVKLTDIGFAWNMQYQTEIETKSPMCCTIAYAAPEVLMGNLICELSADLWALGVIFYALWNRCLPFPGHVERDVILNIQKMAIIWKRGNNHAVDRPANDLVHRLLQISPKDRISCQEVMKHRLFTSTI
uniref:Protein kinase domain-containing protein n=1 Tax=Strigamia maritima TaxID=126957 RepID=T1IML9_STRMM